MNENALESAVVLKCNAEPLAKTFKTEIMKNISKHAIKLRT
jgi:hypothetical protein